MGEQIPLEPTRADHYLTLGVSQTATTAQIKKAFHRLALIHHPDKSAPGQTVDAADFRQVKEAYEVLVDTLSRTRYDASYRRVQTEWLRYRETMARWKRDESERERQKQARGREREHTTADEKRRQERERYQRAEEKERAERQKSERARLAEQRSRKAAERAQAEREVAAKERLRRMKEAEAEDRTAQVLERARQYNAQKAQERMEQEARLAAERLAANKEAALKETLKDKAVWDAFEAARRFEQRLEKKQHDESIKLFIESLDNARTQRKSELMQALENARTRSRARDSRIALAKQHVRTKQDDYLKSTIGRHKVELEGTAVELGWRRKFGTARCDFCTTALRHIHFKCPDGDAIACTACMAQLSSNDAVPGSSTLQESAEKNPGEYAATSKGTASRRRRQDYQGPL